jgi:hypothetical protein
MSRLISKDSVARIESCSLLIKSYSLLKQVLLKIIFDGALIFSKIQQYNLHQRNSTAYLNNDLKYIYNKREALTRIWQQRQEYNMLTASDVVNRPEKVTEEEKQKRNLKPSLTEAEK